MAEALIHSGDFPHGRSRAQPYIPGLLFKSGMENMVACVGPGQSNPATVTIGTATMAAVITVTAIAVTEMTSTAPPALHAPTFYVWERRKPEPRGSIGNSSRIPISGCLQLRNSIT